MIFFGIAIRLLCDVGIGDKHIVRNKTKNKKTVLGTTLRLGTIFRFAEPLTSGKDSLRSSFALAPVSLEPSLSQRLIRPIIAAYSILLFGVDLSNT